VIASARAAAALLALGAAACGVAPASADGAAHSTHGLDEVRIGELRLDPRAFVAQTAFVFPDETREVVRSLLRQEFAAREAERLGLAPDLARVERELADFERGVAAEFAPGEDLESWSRARYGRRWDETRLVLADQLARNQLYQLCVRAEARMGPRARMHWLLTADEEQARTWARQLAGGLDPRALAAESRVRGSEPDGSFPAAAARLPAPHRDALEGRAAGAVIGPLRFDGDRAWWVGRVAETLPAGAALPPVAELLAELDHAPLSPLEGRAWFEAMLSRYTASEGAPSITAPVAPFVPSR
jgi:hypothetical protein